MPAGVTEALVRVRRNYATQIAVQGSLNPRERKQLNRVNALPPSIPSNPSIKVTGKKLDRSSVALTAAAKKRRDLSVPASRRSRGRLHARPS